jgi:hypothetical protein
MPFTVGKTRGKPRLVAVMKSLKEIKIKKRVVVNNTSLFGIVCLVSRTHASDLYRFCSKDRKNGTH